MIFFCVFPPRYLRLYRFSRFDYLFILHLDYSAAAN